MLIFILCSRHFIIQRLRRTEVVSFRHLLESFTSFNFLIDTEAEHLPFPKDTTSPVTPLPGAPLYAANGIGIAIATYGEQSCTLDLNLRRTFR